ncbi:hypothetical protein ACBJ59_40040 [Nonomuraea sp. MTCD27]|uniref:hypothetical protein n=1 Tax=Nonomuraea sp. MTCD27 TaxID=1676747 RepID=UPI0035BFAE0A
MRSLRLAPELAAIVLPGEVLAECWDDRFRDGNRTDFRAGLGWADEEFVRVEFDVLSPTLTVRATSGGAPPYLRPSGRPPCGRATWGPVPDGGGTRAGHRASAPP